MYDNYFNDAHPLKPYTRSIAADPRSSAPATNATRGKTPTIKKGFWPCRHGEQWVQVEDHRARAAGGVIPGKAAQEATEYWLAEDAYDAPPRHMGDIGPLPAGAMTSPPEPSLEEARAAKLAEIMAGYQSAFAPIETVYPATEREGWPLQEAEARALLADPTAETPTLSVLVQLRGRGETPADLAAKVLANAGQWRLMYASLTGQQQRMYAEVSALETVEEIQEYKVEYQLPEVG